MLLLKKLTTNDGKEVYDMLQQIESNDHGFMNDVKGMSYDEYTQWLKQNDDCSNNIGLQIGRVPQTTFWLYDGSTPVGIGRIRHYLTDALKENGGHVGYAIASSYRGNGYGNTILKLLLNECREMGIFEILLDPYKHNEASNKVIRNNGGKLFKETDNKNYYTIDID
ncbi:MAG: GNAT family N-acetyltransferase [Defluviitaleaceae bacterium]|nr:GNAT family N-acetyltransferase [Defluviitaleaceae bacterium]